MVKDVQILKVHGCSDLFISIVEKYMNLSSDLEQLESFVDELERYKAGESIHPFEQDVLDLARERLAEPLILPVSRVGNDDSTEAAIRRNEMDYNGDVFETMGYEMFTVDGRRY